MMMIAFEKRIRFEAVLVRLRGVVAFRSLGDHVVNLLVRAGSQSGYRKVFLTDIIEQVVGPRQLLDPS